MFCSFHQVNRVMPLYALVVSANEYLLANDLVMHLHESRCQPLCREDHLIFFAVYQHINDETVLVLSELGFVLIDALVCHDDRHTVDASVLIERTRRQSLWRVIVGVKQLLLYVNHTPNPAGLFRYVPNVYSQSIA